MERKELEKIEALRLASLLNDVKAIKDTLEVKGIRENIIAMVLHSNDIVKLKKAEKQVDQTLFPKKPIDNEKPEEEGNG